MPEGERASATLNCPKIISFGKHTFFGPSVPFLNLHPSWAYSLLHRRRGGGSVTHVKEVKEANGVVFALHHHPYTSCTS